MTIVACHALPCGNTKWPTNYFNFVMYLAILNNEILLCGYIRHIHGFKNNNNFILHQI